MPTVKTGSACLARMVSGQVLPVHWMPCMNSQQKEGSKSLFCSGLQWVASKHALEVAVVNQMVLVEFKRGQVFPISHFEMFYTELFYIKHIYDLKEMFPKPKNKAMDDCSHALLFFQIDILCLSSFRERTLVTLRPQLQLLFSCPLKAVKPSSSLWGMMTYLRLMRPLCSTSACR